MPYTRPLTSPLTLPLALRPTLNEGVGAPAWARGTDLWKDFTVPRGTLADPTDTHISTINALNSAASYQSFAANVLTRTDLGLQTVPTKKNGVLRSNDFSNASWTKSAITATANQAVNFDGSTTAYTLLETVTNTQHSVNQFNMLSGDLSGATAVNVSVVLASVGGRWAYIQINNQDSSTAAIAYFNLSGAGAVGTVSDIIAGFTAKSASIVALGNGLYRATFALTTSAATTSFGTFVGPATGDGTNSYAGDITKGLVVGQVDAIVGSFPVAPIITTSAFATVNGNQQVIDLTGRLGTGVAGFVQVNVLDPGSNYVRVFEFNDGTSNNKFTLGYSTAALSIEVWNGGIFQQNINLAGAWSQGVQTIAFAAQGNFIQARKVGQSANTAIAAVVSWPSMSSLAIGGSGYSASQNIYQRTSKVALSFGAQNQTTFDAMYARAVLAAAS